MTARIEKIDTGVSVGIVVSAVIHLAVFLLLAWSGRIFPQKAVIQEAYYVDVVTLPVAAPQAGSSAQTPSAPPDLPSPPKTVPSPQTMVQKTVEKAASTPVKSAPVPKTPDSESAFDERMARLQKNIEARRQDAVLEKLQSKVKAGPPKTGMPGAGGTEAGSRYVDYIKSRLEDALELTSSYTSKNPEVTVRLAIAPDGKLLRMKVERSSGDAAFELAVRRAIDLASKKFTPPPNGSVFENGFVFKPRGISSGLPK